MEKFFEAKRGEVTIYEKLHQEVYTYIKILIRNTALMVLPFHLLMSHNVIQRDTIKFLKSC